ncbi:MAG: MBL fold metallo-hydrolase [Acidobacteriota bacterium]
MRTFFRTVAVATALAAGANAQDAKAVLAAASKAMGADNLTSITFTGSASNVNFGQAPASKGPWAGNPITSYVRTITLGAQPASRATGTQMTPPITGGPPTPQPFNQNITPANAAWAQQLEIYLTPWGFLKGAAASNATVSRQKVKGTYDVVSYMTTQKAPSGSAYKVNGYIDPKTNMIDRVETWLEHPLLGDMLVENVFGNYRDFGGVKVPMKIQQRRGGDVTFDATLISATPNPANVTELMTPPPPAAGKGGPAPGAAKGGGPPAAPAVVSEKLAEGVYRITGGYVAMAVEFKTYIMVLEGPQSEARGLAVIAEAKRLIPNKPIKYVFNTHYHFDHSSGLAPFVAEGATIITQKNNVEYLSRALSTPRTLLEDALAKSGKQPKFVAVDDKYSIGDGTRTIEFHHIAKGMNHTNGMLIAFLPKEKVLFQGDFTLPAAGQPANEFVLALGENLKRLKLDYERYVPVHAPNPDVPWTRADVEKALAAKSEPKK